MSYKLASAYLELEARTTKMENQIEGARDRVMNLMSSIGQVAGMFGIGLSLGGIIAASRRFIATAVDAIDAEQRLRAVIVATGKSAGFTAEEIMEMAKSLQAVTTFGDDEIVTAATRMMQFRSVTGDTFKEAIKLSADLSAAGFGTVTSAAMMLGRALEDPVRGLMSLRKAGVMFNQQERENLKLLMESGRAHEAHRIILDRVRGSVGGVSEALANTPAGQWKQLNNLISDVGKELGKIILPAAVQLAKMALVIAQGFQHVVGAVFAVNDALNGWPVKLGLAVMLLKEMPVILAAIQNAIQYIAATVIRAQLLTGWGAVLVAIGAVLVVIYELVRWLASLPKVQSAWNDMVKHLEYAWMRVMQVVQTVAKVLYSVFEPVIDWLTKTFGMSFDFLKEGFVGVVVWAIEGFGKLMAYLSEWLVVIVANFDKVWLAIQLGVNFTAMAFYDTLVHAFTAPFKILIDVATRTFAMIPRLFEAAMAGGIEGFAQQLMTELNEAIAGAVETATDVKFSDTTLAALSAYKKTIHDLALEQKKLEDQRGDFMKDPAKKMAEEIPKEIKAKVQVTGKFDMPTGLIGLTEMWSAAQDALLKQESPEEKMAEGIMNIEEINDMMHDELVKLNTDGVKLANVAMA